METQLRTVLLILLGGAMPAAAAVEPSLEPQIVSVFPHGGRIGSSFEVTIRGKHLDAATRLEFASPRIQTRIISSSFQQVRAQVTIAEQAESGSHEFRL